jgi:hypothetical protein
MSKDLKKSSATSPLIASLPLAASLPLVATALLFVVWLFVVIIASRCCIASCLAMHRIPSCCIVAVIVYWVVMLTMLTSMPSLLIFCRRSCCCSPTSPLPSMIAYRTSQNAGITPSHLPTPLSRCIFDCCELIHLQK